MPPKVTVITPTYNRAELLRETIESVLKQTLRDFEYYIIDDGSTDNTAELVQPYLQDTRAHYVYQENGGEPSAVNHGWQLASGEYFVQVNSDDPALPNLLEEMCKAMDAHPNAIVGYCDFQFIDEHGEILSTTRSPDWAFPQYLIDYNCHAAAPGSFFRRSALRHWETLRQDRYRHINDVEMYWDMALEGNFLHIPKVLATWRQHSGQISNKRYLSIPEIEDWYERYFSKPNLPESVKACQAACRNAIIQYERKLITDGDLPDGEKNALRYALERRVALADYRYINLQVGDNDLIGNKFNGHDLHLLLQQQGVQSFHYVLHKQSNDEKTCSMDARSKDNYARWILSGKEFLLSGIVHLHLIHNTNFDIQLLPLLTRIKPIVMTMHDPFFTTGHCIHSHDCEKWKTLCTDCEHLDWPFAMREDTTALQFLEKQTAFQHSNISIIVASEWMRQRIEASPILQGKKTYLLPFGVNQNLFMPGDTRAAKQALGIDPDAVTLMFRADESQYKGLNIIREALRSLNCKKTIVLITVYRIGLMNEFANSFDLREYGWVISDTKLVQLYQACDIFLMPSVQDAFGMMAIEAMSCGKPVLAITGTALPDVIHSPECGLAVERSDYSAALQCLINSEEERRTRGERSLAYAREHYSIERYISGMLAIYDDVMSHFVPSDCADTLIRQLLKQSHSVPFLSSQADLCQSRSWRITKPLRALTYVCRTKSTSTGPFKRFKEYMQNDATNVASNEDIMSSTSWRITAPLRIITNLIRRNTPT